MFQSIQQRQEELAKLTEYFSTQDDGAEILWTSIEQDTGVSMDVNGPGRETARRALRKLKRPYEALRGDGVRLSAATNSMKIMSGRFVRIDNSVRRADRTHKELSDRHFEQFDPQDKSRMLVLSSFFGTVKAFASEARRRLLERKKEAELKKPAVQVPQLPKIG